MSLACTGRSTCTYETEILTVRVRGQETSREATADGNFSYSAHTLSRSVDNVEPSGN